MTAIMNISGKMGEGAAAMERDRERLSINAAKLYYHSGYSQQDIARELGISRPSVSRLLQHGEITYKLCRTGNASFSGGSGH